MFAVLKLLFLKDESTGPLEATIHNLQREIENKRNESQELQRAWMQQQIELVSMENKNNKLSDSLSMMQSKTTVIKQKKRRLEAQSDRYLEPSFITQRAGVDWSRVWHP